MISKITRKVCVGTIVALVCGAMAFADATENKDGSEARTAAPVVSFVPNANMFNKKACGKAPVAHAPAKAPSHGSGHSVKPSPVHKAPAKTPAPVHKAKPTPKKHESVHHSKPNYHKAPVHHNRHNSHCGKRR